MGVAEAVAIGVAGGLAIGVAGGVAIGAVEAVAMGVAGGVEMGAADGVATGVAGGAARGAVEGVAGTENNSKSLMTMGIDGTGDSVACGCAKLREIPKAVVRTKKKKFRMAQVNFACRAGVKNMRGSLGQVSLYDTRGGGRKRMKSACFALTLVGCISLVGGPAAAIGGCPVKKKPSPAMPGWAFFLNKAIRPDRYLWLWFAASAAILSSLLTWSRSSLAAVAQGVTLESNFKAGNTIELEGIDAKESKLWVQVDWGKISELMLPASRSGPATQCQIVRGGRGHPR
jgi:hypothetical protein